MAKSDIPDSHKPPINHFANITVHTKSDIPDIHKAPINHFANNTEHTKPSLNQSPSTAFHRPISRPRSEA